MPRTPLLPAIVLCALLQAPATAEAGGEGRAAPSFSARTLDGKPLRSNDLKGRPMVIDFWATWCGPCRASMPHLDALQSQFEEQGLVVIGFSVDEDAPQRVRAYANKLGVRFSLAMADERLLDLYGPIRQIPTTFFVNRRGEIVRRVVGYVDRETLEGYVRELF